MMVEAVIVGGTDTTRNQLGCAVALFAEHPDQWAAARRASRSWRQRAVEETMRYFGAVRGTGPLRQRGHRVPGRAVPGRDVHRPVDGRRRTSTPTCSPDPGSFDITREPAGQPQLTFGSGIHYCLGAALARGRAAGGAAAARPPACPTSRSTARSRGSPTPSASSAPTTSRCASPPGH